MCLLLDGVTLKQTHFQRVDAFLFQRAKGSAGTLRSCPNIVKNIRRRRNGGVPRWKQEPNQVMWLFPQQAEDDKCRRAVKMFTASSLPRQNMSFPLCVMMYDLRGARRLLSETSPGAALRSIHLLFISLTEGGFGVTWTCRSEWRLLIKSQDKDVPLFRKHVMHIKSHRVRVLHRVPESSACCLMF